MNESLEFVLLLSPPDLLSLIVAINKCQENFSLVVSIDPMKIFVYDYRNQMCQKYIIRSGFIRKIICLSASVILTYTLRIDMKTLLKVHYSNTVSKNLLSSLLWIENFSKDGLIKQTDSRRIMDISVDIMSK